VTPFGGFGDGTFEVTSDDLAALKVAYVQATDLGPFTVSPEEYAGHPDAVAGGVGGAGLAIKYSAPARAAESADF
jgi:hypothetical protein